MPTTSPKSPLHFVRLTLAALALIALTLTTEGQAWVQAIDALDPSNQVDLTVTIPREAAESEVILVAFGDMMLDRYVWTLMQRNGMDYPFEYFPELLDSMLTTEEGERMDGPDFLFANLEGPISDANYVNPGTAMVFNFRPEVVPTLQQYGFNLFSLANNHAYDMGEDHAEQTRAYLDAAGINHFGDARDLNEHTVWTTTIENTSFAFIGFNDTLSDRIDVDAANELIRTTDATVDFTIVSIHWGTEYRTSPDSVQIEKAHGFVEAGADLVLGHHPHVIQYKDGEPVEWFAGPDGDRPIVYSLGNFIFDQYFQKEVQEGLGVRVIFQKSLDPEKPDRIEVDSTVFDLFQSQPQVRPEGDA